MSLDVVHVFIPFCTTCYVLYKLFQVLALQINFDAGLEAAQIRHMPVTAIPMIVLETQMKVVAHVSNDKSNIMCAAWVECCNLVD